jgi:hypothetical protein
MSTSDANFHQHPSSTFRDETQRQTDGRRRPPLRAKNAEKMTQNVISFGTVVSHGNKERLEQLKEEGLLSCYRGP